MQSGTLQLLQSRGYAVAADGSFSRPDSQRLVPASAPLRKGTLKKEKRGPSELALKFEAVWQALKGPELTPEHRFHPTRKWRLDYYHPGTQIAIELEGGIFCRGRHSRPKGMQGDCDKYNSAASMGIFVFRLTTGQVTRERIEPIIHAILSKAAK